MKALKVSLVTLTLCLAASAADAAGQPDRPNIVLIMADDIGVECLGSYGSEIERTPNLDRFAASGMRFENAHSQPICTPSRVQLMTGIHNNRNYIRFGLLDPAAITFGNVLRGAGYDTCVAGKWQLEGGFDAPRRFGFDRYCLWQLTRRPSRYPNPGLEIDGVERDFKDGGFGPDIVSDYVCDFIAEQRSSPFFVYYPMIAPHWPFVPTPDHPDWDPAMWRDAQGEPGGYKDPKYWDAMVKYTDKMVGKVLDQLDRSGLRDNTLVIWTGDNGTYQSVVTPFRGRDVRGGKGTTKDAGTHVGFMARWPGVIQPGTVTDSLVDFTDVFSTLMDAAGVDVSDSPAMKRSGPLDGVSLMPTFQGKSRDKTYIYCWYERNGQRGKASQHVHNAKYKLYADGRYYDIVDDPDESIDLAQAVPDEAIADHRALSKALQRHTRITRDADARQKMRRGMDD